jgi:hypothetical protein
MSIEETNYDAMMDNIADKSTGNADKSNSRSLSIEELLKPRYKVIAEDTSGNFRIGDMFIKSNYGDWFESGTFEMPEWELQKYPHLFCKLEWWEERKESEMPEYVKDLYDQEPFKIVSKHPISKDEYLITNRPKPAHYAHIKHFLPATEEEYIQYQQNKKQ